MLEVVAVGPGTETATKPGAPAPLQKHSLGGCTVDLPPSNCMPSSEGISFRRAISCLWVGFIFRADKLRSLLYIYVWQKASTKRRLADWQLAATSRQKFRLVALSDDAVTTIGRRAVRGRRRHAGRRRSGRAERRARRPRVRSESVARRSAGRAEDRYAIRYRACQLYKNISMLFLFPVKDGKLSTGVNASCYG